MTYKEFKKWCNNRCCDGCWGLQEAVICVSIIKQINSKNFFKRQKIWHEVFEKDILKCIIEPINKKRKELGWLDE